MALTDNSSGSELLQGGGRFVFAPALTGEQIVTDRIKIGTIFIQEGTTLPNSLKFESDPYSNGWRSVKTLNRCALDRKIREAGWNLFDLAQIKASVFRF
ncbi:MAG: hypothetical protein EXQ58_07500 [Acidobacteria bacterium]|nr:hypothetical protein [Acidobacteriota bacterium]